MPSAPPQTKTIRLDIGCGSVKLDGWVGMDAVDIPTVDIVHDLLDLPWPIESGTVSEARCLHVIEHIPMPCMCSRDQRDPLLATFDELWRILVPGGSVVIETPHSSSLRAWQDPTHRRAINQHTYKYTNRAQRQEMHVDHYPVSCNFSVAYAFITDGDGSIQDLRATLTKLL